MKLLFTFVYAWVGVVGAVMAAPATQPARVDYAIIVTGGEILEGAFPDGHTHFITRTLFPLGLHCVGSMTVDDRRQDIFDALRFALRKSPLVIVTGGLGPTDNDITRETLAEFTGIELVEHPAVLAEVEKRYGTPLRPNVRRQTRVPARGGYLGNAGGTAVGLVFESDNGVIVALPGPPRELQPMVREQLVPYLRKRFGARLPGASVTLRFVGIGQSQITQTIHDKVQIPPDVITTSAFEGMRVDFSFSLPEDTPENRRRLDEFKQQVVAQLRPYIYTDDPVVTLEQHVEMHLLRRGWKLAVAEVGTGGALAAGLSAPRDAASVFVGAHVATMDAAMNRLLGLGEGASLQAVAEAAARHTGTECAIAVGQATEDERGGRWVAVAYHLPGLGIPAQRIALRGDDAARHAAVTQILDHLRRRLSEQK